MPELLVLGGDAAGDYHARQLRRAGAGEVVMVRSDWGAALKSWLRSAGPDDQVVPGPLMPHLLWDWLAGELDAVAAPAPRGWGLPYEMPGAGGALYLSVAAWVCPATCVEPAICPAIHRTRDWDLAETIERRAVAEGMTPAVFRCLQYAGGIGTVPAGVLQAAAREPVGAGGTLVATTSHCHAAVGCLAPRSYKV